MDESAVLELIELSSGEIALKRIDSDDKPLVKIQFSDESEMALESMKMLVARAMVEAGIEAFSEMSQEPDFNDTDTEKDRLH